MKILVLDHEKLSSDFRSYIEILKALQLKTGLDVYSFSKIPENFAVKHRICSDIGVEHFIQLFESSSYVVTSSFHGTAFAANFGVPIYSVVNDLNATIPLPTESCPQNQA